MLGRNCRFLQGEGTDTEEVQRLRDALAAEPPRAVTVRLLNFCYDGTPFWNSLHVAPVRNAAGQVRLGHCHAGFEQFRWLLISTGTESRPGQTWGCPEKVKIWSNLGLRREASGRGVAEKTLLLASAACQKRHCMSEMTLPPPRQRAGACLGNSAMQVGLQSFCVWTLLD